MLNHEHANSLVKEHGSPLFILSEKKIRLDIKSLKEALPEVIFYYAVKANPEPLLLNIINEELGTFDICSNKEIDLIEAIGARIKNSLHTHPIKTDYDIRYALEKGIKTFTLDNEYEIKKLIPYKEKIEVMIRFGMSNPDAVINLSQKFGTPPEKVENLVQSCWDNGIKVRGLSFHAGSQNLNAHKIVKGIEIAFEFFTMAKKNMKAFKTLDIGGGFPVSYLEEAPEMGVFCKPIREALKKLFPETEIIAEPGRAIAASCVTLASSVIGKSKREDTWWYYLDDGLYNSFSGKVYDSCDYLVQTLRTGEGQACILAGPTCDSFDVIYDHITLPTLEIGDVLLFPAMGAYAGASATNFNGYETAKMIMID